MGRKIAALLVVVPCVVGTMITATAFTTAATAAAPPATGIGPHQHFVGLVNGRLANATIAMVCLPPLDPGQTGHPLGGQTVAVEPPPATAGSTGDTGSRGRSIIASFALPSAVGTSTLTFTHYGSQQIPTTFTLPCGGSGAVVFSPSPTSKTAQSATVKVTFGNITVDPPPTGTR